MFQELHREETREEGDRGGQKDKGGIKKSKTDPASNQFPTKVRLVKAVVFPVVMYGCESWTVKKAER